MDGGSGERKPIANDSGATFGEELQRFVGMCQVLAVSVARRERPLRDVAESLATSLPRPQSSADFLLLRSILVEFAARALDAVTSSPPEAIFLLLRVQPPDGDLAGALLGCLLSGSNWRPEPSGSLQELRAIRAMSLISMRCSDPHLTAESIAEAIGVSRQHLARLLRSHYRCGFRLALTRARLQTARPLLEQPVNSIKEVAAKVGYSSTSQFDRDFKRECQVTPGQYRRDYFATAWGRDSSGSA
jgi:AraC-like DNA-binding protein